MTLRDRLHRLERGRTGSAQPDYSAVSDTDIASLIRLYSRLPITDADHASAIRADSLIRNRDARPFAYLSDGELAERIAAHA